MRLAATAALPLGAGYAFAYDTDSGTAGRTGGVLTNSECLVVWHNSAGDELKRFHRVRDGLSPANAKRIITNFQQSDTDRDGYVSEAEFLEACKLGFVNAGAGGPEPWAREFTKKSCRSAGDPRIPHARVSSPSPG